MKIEQKGKYLVIHLDEKKIGVNNVANIKKSIMEAIETAGDSIVLDFSNVDYVDSSGLGLLLSLQKKVGSKDLRLAGMNSSIVSLLKLTKLDTVFKIFDSIDEALK